MKKLINTHVLAYKHCQFMKTTGEARPSETEAAEKSELSVSMISVEESKEDTKSLMLSIAFVELVVDSKEVEKISDKKVDEKKDGDKAKIHEEMQV